MECIRTLDSVEDMRLHCTTRELRIVQSSIKAMDKSLGIGQQTLKDAQTSTGSDSSGRHSSSYIVYSDGI